MARSPPTYRAVEILAAQEVERESRQRFDLDSDIRKMHNAAEKR